ncbi:MAG: Trigger factor [Candidatus Saccharibacteria bacterium]|nr:Trigger factor [Candidatus Saccharibacteria bacterium]
MQVKRELPSDTELILTVSADTTDLTPLKEHVLRHLQAKVKVAGFREGKAPLPLVEKNTDPSVLQTEFLEEAVNHLYANVLQKQNIRAVDRPEVQITKFVPFSELEFTATVSIIGDVVLGDYKKIKKTKTKVSVTAKNVNEVLERLQQRAATRKAVERAAKKGDEIIIDFSGQDQKGQAIPGTDGQDYPLLLGSDSFIPGFEVNLIGTKPGQKKSFTLTFPKDYGASAMRNKKVTFTVTVKTVQELSEAKLDDAFAATVGPFKTIEELKIDIKKQITADHEQEATRLLENEIVSELVAKSKASVPKLLVDEQIELIIRDQQQNLVYRGQTFPEFLAQEGKTEDEFRASLRPQAEERVKAGILLSEVAEKEGLVVTPEELEIQLQLLKGQYQDPGMQAELSKPEAGRDIASRILTQKTLARLTELSTK